MRYQKISWLGFIALFGIVASTSSVSAQKNQSDVSGYQTFSTPSISIGSQNSNGSVTPTVEVGSLSGSGSGTGIQSNNGNAVPTVEVGSLSGSGSGAGNTNQVSINDAASLLNQGLNQSLNSLASVGQQTQKAPIASSGPRRIARRSSSHACGCANPASTASPGKPRRIARNSPGTGKSCGCGSSRILEAKKGNYTQAQARKIVEQQLDVSKKFIEQVNQIEPQNNIW